MPRFEVTGTAKYVFIVEVEANDEDDAWNTVWAMGSDLEDELDTESRELILMEIVELVTE